MKVGVFDMGGSGWTGGITYLRNLGYAVKSCLPDQVSLVLVRQNSSTPGQPDWVSNYFSGTIELGAFGNGNSILEIARKSVSVLTGGDVFNARRIERALRPANVDVLFGMGLTNRFTLPSVGWFPDFQHVDLPEFFSRKEVLIRDIQVNRMAKNCRLMVFSSRHALKHFVLRHPRQASKGRVLNFVAHLPSQVLTKDPSYLLQKLRIPEKFIYLPNQLWRHKNHMTALRAVKILADRGERISLICSGNLTDFRHPDYKDEVMTFIRTSGLSDQVIILGMVDFDDVYSLIRQSCCVLNPSLYEGWSTTVEETKTIGKPLILSDLEVHREQNPPEVSFFETRNPESLAVIMGEAWKRYSPGPNRDMEARAAADYPRRAKAFAETFASICGEAMDKR